MTEAPIELKDVRDAVSTISAYCKQTSNCEDCFFSEKCWKYLGFEDLERVMKGIMTDIDKRLYPSGGDS